MNYRQDELTGYGGMGELYQAPDGSLYQMSGFGETDNLRGLDADELTQIMGMGYLGEFRQGPDGNLYQWVQGMDGLGNLYGFWSKLKNVARKVVRGAGRILKKAFPIAKFVAPFIPGVGPVVAAGLKYATPLLRKAGVAGHDGLGQLYQTPDGTMYQVQGLQETVDLYGFDNDETISGMGALYQAPDGVLYHVQGISDADDLRGLDETEELRGMDEAEELRGLSADEDLRGLEEDEPLQGFDESDSIQGLEQGYIPTENVNGLEAYVPDQPAATRMFVQPAQTPEMWRPIW